MKRVTRNEIPLDKDLSKILVKCYVWSVPMYGAETWTTRKEVEGRTKTLEVWVRIKMA